MALEAGADIVDRGQAFVERIVENSGAAGETLLQDQVSLSQRGLEPLGPALLFIEAQERSIGAVGAVGAVAMGVGVAQTYDMLLQLPSHPFNQNISSRRRECKKEKYFFPLYIYH